MHEVNITKGFEFNYIGTLNICPKWLPYNVSKKTHTSQSIQNLEICQAQNINKLNLHMNSFNLKAWVITLRLNLVGPC